MSHDTATGPVARLLDKLEGVKRNGKGWIARCPAHEDRQASLSITTGDDEKVLVKCFAGCSVETIVGAVGLTVADLFNDNGGGGVVGIPHRTRATVQHPPKSSVKPPAGRCKAPVQHPATPVQHPPGCRLAQYADAKRLPVEFLRSVGLSDVPNYAGSPAVKITYLGADGAEIAVRFRVGMSAEGERFRWRNGSKPAPYGLSRLADARSAGRITLCEGESDTQTLWYHREPALGIPGANCWREEWAAHLDGIATIYVVIEPDRGGETVLSWLAKSRIRDRARLVTLAEHKDPSGLYLADPDHFRERWQAALDAAKPVADLLRVKAEADRADAWDLCGDLASKPDILTCAADTVRRLGVANEDRAVKLIFLAVMSRVLLVPVSVAVKGPSSAGKNHITESVLRLFPAEAFYALSAMSERALAYSDEPLQHRMLVVYEAAGMGSDFATYLMRSLLSEGRIRYETVEKTKDGMKPRLIEREGPTGLIVTTTATHLHPENETRLLSVPVTDTREQTQAVLRALATQANDDAHNTVSLDHWHALQRWITGCDNGVLIPYADPLAELVPPVATRLRRDFSALLTLIKTHAILHQATRDRDVSGRIVATTGDYAAVRELVADLMSAGVGATVSATVRATVEAAKIVCEKSGTASVNALAEELKLDKSAVSRRVKQALEAGFIVNEEDRKGKPYRLKIGEPMPDDVPLLPATKALDAECCTVASDSDGIDTPPPPLPTDGSCCADDPFADDPPANPSCTASVASVAPTACDSDDPEVAL